MFCSAWPQPKPWPGEAGGWGDFAKCMLPCYVYSALRYFFLSISFSWVDLRLHTENQLHMMPGRALKVCVGGWWWWC